MEKTLICFDLDGTLAESKSEMDKEMSQLFIELLKRKKVAVMSGGAYKQFIKQFLGSLNAPKELLKKLYLFPTCGTSFYKYENGWENIYEELLSEEEKKQIIEAFNKALPQADYKKPETIYGEILEDRETQITFSALGQLAPVKEKKHWDPNQEKRKKIKQELDKLLPNFEIRIGGSTSIDVTRKGIDKAYGIKQIEKYLGIKKEEILFIGDALFEGGNDYPVKACGVECIQIEGPEDTKKEIKKIVQAHL